MTRQQELELLAEWMGFQNWTAGTNSLFIELGSQRGSGIGHYWNPLTSNTDFLNMVAGRVDFVWYHDFVQVQPAIGNMPHLDVFFKDHNNDKVAAMKHAAYQVFLMAAGEWKGEQNG